MKKGRRPFPPVERVYMSVRRHGKPSEGEREKDTKSVADRPGEAG